MSRRAIALMAAVLAIPAAVLAYGYWFGVTHGALLVYAADVTDREHQQDIKPIHLTFLDAAGHTLAEASGAAPTGVILLSSPPRYACHDIEERAPFSLEARHEWQVCFARQSRWLPTWIRNVRAVNLTSGSCTIARLPVSVEEHPDTWWLWWVPLRHIGGKPYTTFNVRIEIDRRTMC